MTQHRLTPEAVEAIAAAIFAEPGAQVLEACSELDEEPRQFGPNAWTWRAVERHARRLQRVLEKAIVTALVFLVVEAAASAAAASSGSRASSPRNLSGIEIAPLGLTSPAAGVSACRGLWRYGDRLGDVGLTDADLRAEVTCIAADFEANGSVDFLVWGRHEPSQRGLRGTRRFKVLFFDGQRLIRAETIRHEDYDHAVIWPRGRGSNGACKVQPPTVDGIMLLGEGGGSWYYVYKASSRRLRGERLCDE